MYVVSYSLGMLAAYSDEAEAIRKKSQEHLGVDISAGLGFFEVLKSAHYELWTAAWAVFILVFIPYLLIAAYFFDYQKEAHSGWRRVYISAQLLIPALFTLYAALATNIGSLYVSPSILFFTIAEIVVLILIKIFIWIREGFAAKAE